MSLNAPRQRRSKTFYNNAVIYFCVILVLSVSIISGTVIYAQKRLMDVQTRNELSSLQQAADELNNQFAALGDIANMIGTDANYLPAMVKHNNYHDILVLDGFKRFGNYSPIANEYFLAYDFMDKVYLSNGYNSYFKYYAANSFHMDQETAGQLYQMIMSLKEPAFLQYADDLFYALPISFYRSAASAGNGVMCFVINSETLESYLGGITYNLPDEICVAVAGYKVVGPDTDPDAENVLTAEAGDLIRISAPFALESWQLLIARNRLILIPVVIALLCVSVVLSWLLAKLSLKPLAKLINKYAPEKWNSKNEFLELDSILSDMRSANISSKEQLQDQLIKAILRGYYSEELMERWSMLNISFDLENLCAYVLDIGTMGNEAVDDLRRQVDSSSIENCILYSAVMHGDKKIAVIANYASPYTAMDVKSHIESIPACASLEVFCGRQCASPKHLPISYLEALTAQSINEPQLPEKEADLRKLAEELLIAVKSRNESAFEAVMARVSEYLGSEKRLFMSKQFIYAFINEVAVVAADNDCVLSKTRLNTLVLLPDAETVLGELRSMLEESMREAEEKLKNSSNIARPIVEYVIANAFNPDFDLNMISSRFGMSNDYISSLIKEETGAAFKEYLTMIRISEAKRLLTSQKELTVADVAERVGYRKSSNFSKKFREITGLLPSEYR